LFRGAENTKNALMASFFAQNKQNTLRFDFKSSPFETFKDDKPENITKTFLR
jgi:hypothetical protein